MLNAARLLDSHRSESEDRAAILPASDGSLLLAVADGVAGSRGRGGGRAAQRAMELAEELMAEDDGESDFWSRLLVYADGEIGVETAGGETTCVLAHVHPDGRIEGATVGDSEAWLLGPDGAVTRLTGWFPAKPYLGSGFAQPRAFAGQAAPGGVLLLATDGLFKHTAPAHIPAAALLPDPKDAAAALVGLARSPTTGRLIDDIAVILCQV